MVNYQVGDELACNIGNPGRWVICRIEKITPSGRIHCGQYVLNPDLTVRGSHGWSAPHAAQPVTPEIRAEVLRRKRISFLNDQHWAEMSDDVLESVIGLIKKGTP